MAESIEGCVLHGNPSRIISVLATGTAGSCTATSADAGGADPYADDGLADYGGKYSLFGNPFVGSG